jgi:hypothetical protein
LKFRRTLYRGLIVAVIALVVLFAPRARARAAAAPRKPRPTKPITLEVVFHVAEMDGRPVADEAYLDPRLERANEIFAPLGVVFARKELRPLGAEHATIDDASGRDVLGGQVTRGVVNCFVVRTFRDLGDPNVLRRGVHWHSRTHRGAHFVILSSRSHDINVLAHELGHFMGNPQHSFTHGNLMSYDRGEELPVFDAKQIRNVQRALRRYVATREVRAMKVQPVASPVTAIGPR